jgi:hypothetical protein
MTKYVKAKEVLVRSRDEVLGELVRAGESGGVGLSQRFAPILVNLQGAIEAIDRITGTQDQPKENFAEKMKAAKAAKAAEKVAQ